MLPENPVALEAGARIGRYLILERVGSGAMGVVYGAYDPELDRKVALKLLDGGGASQEPAARARLLREAKAMARLAHPNVVVVHDVGVFEGRVFLAMEFLGGGTLKSWLGSRPRTSREVTAVFAAAGRGLAAAHAAGLVHRDFKPENVLLDKEGRPRVVDFGLARDATAKQTREDLGVSSLLPAAPALELVPALPTTASGETTVSPLDTLTRSGVIMGTPAYMAPEQFLGEATNEQTDQFSFCVALYEALYGERPFTGGSLVRLLNNITEGRLRAPPENRDVPAWIRRAVIRGLQADPAQRWPSMTPLIAALEDDPAARQRRRIVAGAAVVLVLASLVAGTEAILQRRRQLERQVAAHLDEGARVSGAGRAQAAALRDLRGRAFAAFDTPDRTRGESLWRQVLAMIPEVDAATDRAVQEYETALVLDPDRADARAKVSELLYENLLLAEELRREDRQRALEARLDRHGEGRAYRASRDTRGMVVLRTNPASALATLERYQDEPTGRRVLRPVGQTGAVVGQPAALAPGSYRLAVRAPGYADTFYPFELHRGEHLELELGLLPASAVPEGFAYVPPGDFWFGDADERLRTQFLDTVPIHRRYTAGFFIARHETTYREWIQYLEALPAAERSHHLLDVSTALRGSLQLRPVAGEWHLTFQPTSLRYDARAGDPFVYAGRGQRTRQDWREFPVAGTAPADAEHYVRWLRDTGRVPGARLCSELEWERAARGADDRTYPHGDRLEPDDANFDVTYGRVDSAFGPDAVGAHPASRSPFGIDDLAGNVFELTRSSVTADDFVIRGGAYYFAAVNSRITNRNTVPATIRDVTTGIRVCASLAEKR
ncbi:MAG TPA: bifunctional serine/threonine-protein kinase/formylglycine-generating enzyme family protein [Polyangia bacterium]|jgi:formylglycine-generating enzyme required for sulfatase activity|nr:bifunctional serine/threonine-protein kinase/formylglycine-generating enzyme family protein [Polyangia bacterium]